MAPFAGLRPIVERRPFSWGGDWAVPWDRIDDSFGALGGSLPAAAAATLQATKA